MGATARNRFMAATPEEAAYRLKIQSERCLEAIATVNAFSWLYVGAGAFAEAAAHWAFELHPELRVDDEY
jgi:hypothetical protein